MPNYYTRIDIGLAGKKADKQADLHAASDCQGNCNYMYQLCKTNCMMYFRYNRHY